VGKPRPTPITNNSITGNFFKMKKLQLQYSHDHTVANIILNDGKGNVLDDTMMTEMLGVLADLGGNKDIKLITFAGEGKHFSFGASVAEHTKELAPAMLKSFHRIFAEIAEMGIPTAAKISGQCLGGGLELALICNFMFADETAMLGQPEMILGVFPPPASIILPLKVGSGKAEEILLTGRSINTEEGKNIGLLNQVFSDQDAMHAGVDEWISKHILPKSASSLRFGVKAMRVHFNSVLIEKLPELEEMYVNRLMETKDANEGINSFLEKRKPDWVNG